MYKVVKWLIVKAYLATGLVCNFSVAMNNIMLEQKKYTYDPQQENYLELLPSELNNKIVGQVFNQANKSSNVRKRMDCRSIFALSQVSSCWFLNVKEFFTQLTQPYYSKKYMQRCRGLIGHETYYIKLQYLAHRFLGYEQVYWRYNNLFEDYTCQSDKVLDFHKKYWDALLSTSCTPEQIDALEQDQLFIKGFQSRYARNCMNSLAQDNNKVLLRAILQRKNLYGVVPACEISYSADRRQYDIVDMMLDNSPSVMFDPLNIDGDTLLHRGAERGDFTLIKLYLKKMQDSGQTKKIDTKNKREETALYRALTALQSEKQKIKIAHLLLNQNAGVFTPDRHGETPAHKIIWYGLLKLLPFVFREAEGKDLFLLSQDRTGDTILHNAIHGTAPYTEKITMIEELSTYKALLSVPNEDGKTPVFAAAYEGDFALFKLLAKASTPETLLAYDAHGETLLTEIIHGCGSSDDKSKMIDLLLNLTKASDWTDKNGSTALHSAVWATTPKLLKFLLTKPVFIRYIDVRNKKGYTPLHCAVSCYSSPPDPNCEKIESIVRLLLSAGARLSLYNHVRKTPWDMALQKGYTKLNNIFAEYMEEKAIRSSS